MSPDSDQRITSDSIAKDGKATCWWWLRSPGDDQSEAFDVSNSGDRSYYNVSGKGAAVRPAFWINLDAVPN